MLHRYFAVRVSSERGANIYRLIGLAKDTDKTHIPRAGKLPDYLVLTTENSANWVSVVVLSASPIFGRFTVDARLTVEQ